MNFLKNIFNNKRNTVSNTKQEEKIDFDILISNAKKSGEIDDIKYLYSCFFKLKDICCIVSKHSNIDAPKPFIGVVDDLPWLLVFTDMEKAKEYSMLGPENFQNIDGNTLILQCGIDSFINIIKGLDSDGIYGVRFNEGENGWFSPIPSLLEIYQMEMNKI